MKNGFIVEVGCIHSSTAVKEVLVYRSMAELTAFLEKSFDHRAARIESDLIEIPGPS